MMPRTSHSLPVSGTATIDSEGLTLVLSDRLDGYDTFLAGQLVVNGAEPISVRILTLDDVTVLRVLDDGHASIAETWAGVLHLPHGWRTRSLPTDLVAAAADARRDISLLDDAEQRYALTFLGEASSPAIRRARIDLIIHALPHLDDNP